MPASPHEEDSIVSASPHEEDEVDGLRFDSDETVSLSVETAVADGDNTSRGA